MKHKAIVLGLFETGLGVIRSLSKSTKIDVVGVDYKKDVGWYSRYGEKILCPNPKEDEKSFIEFLTKLGKSFDEKPVLFITADTFLEVLREHKEQFTDLFYINIPVPDLLRKLENKLEQYNVSVEIGVNVPKTIIIKTKKEIDSIENELKYPIFVKALDVNIWRERISSTRKGYLISKKVDLFNISEMLLNKNVPFILQELIIGDDTNHYKYCTYRSVAGKEKASFILRKIRQYPIHFGVGSVVESVENPDLQAVAKKMFDKLNYTGVGSAEFKFDEIDKQFKLIEINPRYWQQNYLSTYCGINFPLIHYFDQIGESFDYRVKYDNGIKWVNIFNDILSFKGYKKEGVLSFKEWRNSLKGKKVYSNFTYYDPLPALSEIDFGLKLLKLPKMIFRKYGG